MNLEIDELGTVAILHQGGINTRLARWLRLMPRELGLVTPQGHQIPRQRNMAVSSEDFVGDWLLFIDSDCEPSLPLLPRLLGHKVPIVGAVVLERYAPFNVSAIRSLEPMQKWTTEELKGRDGLLPVPALGMAATLIRREVLEKVPAPWFRAGQILIDCLAEDTDFCFRAAEKGFPSMLDCGIEVGHRIQGTAWRGKDGKVWFEWPAEFEYKLEAGAFHRERG